MVATFLKGGPVEMIKHGRDAACPSVVTHNKAGWATLDLLNLLGIPLGVGVPWRSCKFNSWPNKGGVDSFFYFLAGVAQIAGEEGLGALGFFA